MQSEFLLRRSMVHCRITKKRTKRGSTGVYQSPFQNSNHHLEPPLTEPSVASVACSVGVSSCSSHEPIQSLYLTHLCISLDQHIVEAVSAFQKVGFELL